MKMQYEYANTKLASIPLSLLLILSGLFGFVLLVPLNAAHATGPAVTLSSTSAVVGSSITITGTGFASGATIEITTTVGSEPTTDWLTVGMCSDSSSGAGSANSIVIDDCLTTDARGAFMVTVTVPELPGGANTISVYDGTSTVTSTLTVTSYLAMCAGDEFSATPGKCSSDAVADVSSGYPDISVSEGGLFFSITGFAASESVSIASGIFDSSYSGGLTCTTDDFGGCVINSGPFTPVEISGGAKTITGTGATSGFTATTTFTVQPWVSFFDSQGGPTAFSFLATQPTSLLVEGHGFASAYTIAANSITVGGVTTLHSSVKTDSKGQFGVGAGNHLVVAPNTNVPFGPVSVVVAGTTFNYANGNINMGTPSPDLGGVLIASVQGKTGSTAAGVLDATTHTLADTPAFFGYGFDATGTTNVVVSTTNLPGLTLNGAVANTVQTGNNLPADSNGAVFITSTGGLTSEPAGTYTVAYTNAGGIETNIISPSLTTATSVTLDFDTSTASIDYTLNYDSVGHGIVGDMFAATTSFTVKAGGNTLCTGTTDALGHFSCNLAATFQAGWDHNVYQDIDLASGTYTATASDGTNTGTDTFTIIPIVDTQFTTLTQALTLENGGAGTVTNLRTTTGFGVHGLAANTQYNINWGMVGATGAQSLGSFTTTATGGVPIPGLQFTIPAGTAGDQIITLTQAGSDALFGVVQADLGSNQVEMSQYGDLIFVETITANISPTVANVGQTVTITGTGLAASKAYETSLTATTGAAIPGAQIFSTFTTDANGNIPAAATLVVPAMPAGVSGTNPVGPCNAYEEKATTYYIAIQTASQYGTAGETGQGTLVIAGSAKLNMTSAPAGHAVVLTAAGLCSQGTYDVVLNYGTNPQATLFTGTVVTAFSADAQGSGSATFTVPPGTAAGTYPINLVRLSPAAQNLGALSVLPTLTVAATVGSCTSLGTSCFTAGTPSKTTIGSFTGISVGYTNAATGGVSGIVYAVVHNAAGQTVYYTTATINPAAGGTANAFLVLAGLPAGTYSVSIFVTDTTGVAISTTTSTSVTLP